MKYMSRNFSFIAAEFEQMSRFTFIFNIHAWFYTEPVLSQRMTQ